jgi:hypothetical protein
MRRLSTRTLADLENAYRDDMTREAAAKEAEVALNTARKFFRLFRLEGIPRKALRRPQHWQRRPVYEGPDWIG